MGSAESNQNAQNQDQKLIHLIKNQNASLTLRKDAVKKLIAESPDSAWPVLVDLLQNQKESRILRGFASEMLPTIDSHNAIDALEKISTDKNENMDLRKIALNSLWKVNQERTFRAAG